MKITIDGSAEPALQKPLEDVFAVVIEVGVRLRARGRSIMSVTVDGKAVPAEALAAQLKDRSLDSVSELVIQSEATRSLVDKSLRELHEALPDLPNACREMAAIFHGEDPDSGYDEFVRLAELWSVIKNRELLIADALDMDLSQLELNGKSLESIHAELNDFLNEAIEAIETKDTVALGDLLEYELAPRAELELEIVTLLQAYAAEHA